MRSFLIGIINVFLLGIFSLSLVNFVHAQMMGNFYNQPIVTPTPQDLQDIQTGKDLFSKFENKQLSCSSLNDADFEKIGEYLMQQSWGNNTNAHLQMNNAMKQMMGEQAEEQMHIRLSKNAIGCETNTESVFPMMRHYGYSWLGGMESNFEGGFRIIHAIMALLAMIDLSLLAIFLWRKIKEK